MHHAEMHRCLSDIDVAGARRLWAHARPGMPQPGSDADALVMVHHARTQMQSIALRLRAYSHRWLINNGYPSGLPDELKPKAERIFPRIVGAVGISVNTKHEWLRPATVEIGRAMSDAVENAYADRREEPEFVRSRMIEARDRTRRKLFGALK